MILSFFLAKKKMEVHIQQVNVLLAQKRTSSRNYRAPILKQMSREVTVSIALQSQHFPLVLCVADIGVQAANT